MIIQCLLFNVIYFYFFLQLKDTSKKYFGAALASKMLFSNTSLLAVKTDEGSNCLLCISANSPLEDPSSYSSIPQLFSYSAPTVLAVAPSSGPGLHRARPAAVGVTRVCVVITSGREQSKSSLFAVSVIH